MSGGAAWEGGPGRLRTAARQRGPRTDPRTCVNRPVDRRPTRDPVRPVCESASDPTPLEHQIIEVEVELFISGVFDRRPTGSRSTPWPPKTRFAPAAWVQIVCSRAARRRHRRAIFRRALSPRRANPSARASRLATSCPTQALSPRRANHRSRRVAHAFALATGIPVENV